jgi:CheY-like chemotaxis protein
MSHEIRTPMNGIMGFLNLLNRPNLSGKQQKEYIQIIEKSSNRMLDTINDIINISKIESGYESLIIKEVSVTEIMENLFSFFYPEIKQKGLLFNFFNELTEDNSTIKTDEDKLNSILTNLIKNAIKFTEKGFIEYSCHKKVKESGIYLEFCVADTGIGIPDNRKEAVFDRFVQADIDDIDVYEGSGLGLSISKAYVKLLEGDIWIESKAGLGSKFFFTIPYCPIETKQLSPAKDLKDAELKCLKYLKVLITEDDKTSELLLTKYLKPFCEELYIAHSGYEAIKICQQNTDLDLVLMDIKMPGMNGFEAIRRIRSFNKDAIIIAQSALTISQLESEYGQVGCNDFVTKPINEGELFRKINHYFSEIT